MHFASKYPINGSTIEIQFINPSNRDGISSIKSDTHFADFMIGLTDKKPSVTGNQLNGWNDSSDPDTALSWTDYQGVGAQGGNPVVGTGLTSALPDDEILFGEHNHSWAGMNEDGYEYGESWAPRTPLVRMGIDRRIPSISSPGGGRCSLATFEVATPTPISALPATLIQSSDPEDLTITDDGSGNYYFKS